MSEDLVGSWVSMGKMDATMSYANAENSGESKVTLQPKSIKIESGKAYSADVETRYPMDMLIGVKIHWRRKILGGISNRLSILVGRVKIEPLYMLGDEQTANTKVWCGNSKTPVKILPYTSGYFGFSCQ